VVITSEGICKMRVLLSNIVFADLQQLNKKKSKCNLSCLWGLSVSIIVKVKQLNNM
jgi:hypothetical protein